MSMKKEQPMEVPVIHEYLEEIDIINDYSNTYKSFRRSFHSLEKLLEISEAHVYSHLIFNNAIKDLYNKKNELENEGKLLLKEYFNSDEFYNKTDETVMDYNKNLLMKDENYFCEKINRGLVLKSSMEKCQIDILKIMIALKKEFLLLLVNDTKKTYLKLIEKVNDTQVQNYLLITEDIDKIVSYKLKCTLLEEQGSPLEYDYFKVRDYGFELERVKEEFKDFVNLETTFICAADDEKKENQAISRDKKQFLFNVILFIIAIINIVVFILELF
jgi:hypothetical protein